MFSCKISVFHDRTAPDPGLLVGYGALIEQHNLKVPLPDKLSIISRKRKRYTTSEWEIFTPRHAPPDTIFGHLTFALKYEGLNLHVLKPSPDES